MSEQITGGVMLPPETFLEWAKEYQSLMHRYGNTPGAKIVERFVHGRLRLDHILLPSGEQIPFPPRPEDDR